MVSKKVGKKPPRYKEGDSFKIEVTLIVEEVGNDWVQVGCPELEHCECLDMEVFEGLVNPTVKLIRLQKEREELDKQIEETKKRLGG